MRNSNWPFFSDFDGGSPYILPMDPLLLHNFGGNLFQQFNWFADNWFRQSGFLHVPGSMAINEAFNCMSKLAGAFLVWLTTSSTSNLSRRILGNPPTGPRKSCTQVKKIASTRDNLNGFRFGSKSKGDFPSPFSPEVFDKISSFIMRVIGREAERFQAFPVLSLAAALVPPYGNLSSKVLAVQLENGDMQMHASMDPSPCEVEHRGCSGLSFPELNWARHAVEPKTGIEFPVILDNLLAGESRSSLTMEVLVGTGSRIITIIRIKSVKVYAYGFYVHANSVCEKLGRKYASIPVGELNKCHDFYKDLLREDIGMTLRLVINCNGVKISTVRDAFEKSLRNRLVKTNPDADFDCLRTFGSFFTTDIPLPVGTTVDFRRTTDGQLITEIGGNQIGAVDSKDLCRAFFDMYIGDVPVSEQTKDEIGQNVAVALRDVSYVVDRVKRQKEQS